MKNANLTKWLEMLWSALAEPDQTKRDQQLNAASLLLRDAGLVSPGLVSLGLVAPDLIKIRSAMRKLRSLNLTAVILAKSAELPAC